MLLLVVSQGHKQDYVRPIYDGFCEGSFQRKCTIELAQYLYNNCTAAFVEALVKEIADEKQRNKKVTVEE